ncbi:MAG: hypothetical protein J1E34_05870 [Oscillospiraceae bacterium]|nr:hypothetical protein [Oscillospiraceae bacterium]
MSHKNNCFAERKKRFSEEAALLGDSAERGQISFKFIISEEKLFSKRIAFLYLITSQNNDETKKREDELIHVNLLSVCFSGKKHRYIDFSLRNLRRWISKERITNKLQLSDRINKFVYLPVYSKVAPKQVRNEQICFGILIVLFLLALAIAGAISENRFRENFREIWNQVWDMFSMN